MKIRKEYAVTVLPHRGVAVLTSKNNSWVSWLQGSASVGVQIYDCTFLYWYFLPKKSNLYICFRGIWPLATVVAMGHFDAIGSATDHNFA